MGASNTARDLTRPAGGVAICVALLLAHHDADAGVCNPPSPECHLANGKELIDSEPKRAAEELLASYQLDERTDTLALYALALQRAGRYALALETWKRVIVFRESEIEAGKEAARVASVARRRAARAAITRAQQQSEDAADAMIKLRPNVARVSIRIPAGERFVVTRDGAEVDVSREILVDARFEELVFTRPDGSSQRVVVEAAAGTVAKIDAPRASTAVARKPRKLEQQPRSAPPELVARPSKASPRAELASVRFAEEPRSRTRSRVGLGLVGGGIVAAGIAGGLAYLADRDHDRARTAGCTADDQCPFGTAADLAERSNDRARWAQISALGGGALVATGVTLWFLGRDRRTESAVTLRVGPSSAAIGWRY